MPLKGRIRSWIWDGVVPVLSGLSTVIRDAMAFWLVQQVENAEYPNQVGDQDREAVGGEVFPGRALAFDGVDQAAYVADNGALDVNQASTDFCLTGKIKTSSDITTGQYLFGKSISGGVDGRYGFIIGAGVLRFLCESSGGSVDVPDNITLAVNTEYNVLVRIDLSGGKIYYYIDEVLQNTGGTSYIGSFGTLTNVYEFVIGAGNNGSGSDVAIFYDGQIRDVRIYHKDVTSAANLASLQKGEALGDEVAWWWCEGTDLLEVFDASGNGYHMTAVNFDSTSFVEGNWYSLMNKYGYAIDVIGPEMLTDGDFENGFTGGVGNNWNAISLTATASEDIGANGAGSSQKITYVNQTGRIRQVLDLYSARTYIASGWLKTINSNTVAGIIVRNSGESYIATIQKFSIGVGAWEVFSESYTPAADYINGEISIDARTTSTDTFWADELSLKPYYNTAIPPDMSTVVNGVPTHDILGNTLTFAGQAKYPMVARDIGALTGDGSMYLTITGLLTTDVITAESTDIPTCTVNGRLDIASGDQCYGVTITRAGTLWAYLPMCEGNGNNVYDTSGNSHHGTGTNLDDSNRTVKDTPGDYDYLAEHGVTVVEYSGDTRLIPFLSDKTSQYASVAPVLNASEIYTDYPQGGKNLIPMTHMSMASVWELYVADQQTRYGPELQSGNPVVGVEYIIVRQSVVDFTTVGAANNNEGTVFTAAGTGVTMSAVDTLAPETTQTGLNPITNGGARNSIGALLTTDWDDTAGLGDGYATDATPTIETGDGFSGNAQKIAGDTGGYLQFDTDSFISGYDYEIIFKYRADNSFKVENEGVENIETGIVANTGDAIEKTITYENSGGAGKLRFTLENAGMYLEIDEISSRPIIPGEFFEPEVLGAEVVFVGTNYLLENSYRYLTRYNNPDNGKELILIAHDAVLTTADHNKIMKFTRNA